MAQVEDGDIAGGAYRLEIKPEYADHLKKTLFVEKDKDRYFVNRDLDPTWQSCMDKAGAAWIVTALAQPAGAGPVVSSVIDLTDVPKVGDCNRDWHETLFKAATDYRFEALSVDVKAGDQRVMDYVDLIFGSLSVDVVDLEKDGKVIKGDIKDLKGGMQSLTGQMSQLTTDHSKLAKLIVDENQKRAEAAQVSAQHDRVAAGVATIQLLSRVVLKNNPDVQYKLTTGAKSIGIISNAIIDLGRKGLVSDAQKILLSGNIANAALAIVGLFGPGGQDPTISLLQSGFASVRGDIRELRADMDDQFAVVDHALDTIYSSMQTRFDDITNRLDMFNQRLGDLSLQQKQYYSLSISVFSALLSHEYKMQIEHCRNEDAVNYLLQPEYAQCLQTIEQYGNDDATNDVFTGAVFFDPTLQPEQAVKALDNLDPDYFRGFLAASLDSPNRSMAKTNNNGARQLPSPSPMAWSGAVDTYFAVRSLAPKLKKAGHVDLGLLTEKPLQRFRDTGKKLVKDIANLRQYGAQMAMDIYVRDVHAAAQPLAEAIVEHLSEGDIGVTETSDYRCFTHSFFNNGNDIDFDLYRGSAMYLKTIPPSKPSVTLDGCGADQGNLVAKLSIQHRHIVSGRQATGGMVAALSKSMANALYDDGAFGLGTYESPVVTPNEQVRAAVKAVNANYLSKANMTEWPSEAMAALPSSVSGYAASDKLKTACAKLAESKRYLDALASLYRSNIDIKKGWPAELAALASGLGDDNMCGDLARVAFKDAKFVAQNALGTVMLASFIGDQVNARVVSLKKAYLAAPMNDSLPEIELRLQRIERCIQKDDVPICS